MNSLVLSVTYDCPISCKYCVTRSGPHGGPYLDADFMKEAISVLDDLFGLTLVVFTGGEPLLHKQEVEEAINFAHNRQIWTRIVTNAFWAENPTKAKKVMSQLKNAGLNEINFSCDDLHQEHIPIRNIRNAFWAAKDVGLSLLIAHKWIVNATITPGYLSNIFGVNLDEHKEGKSTSGNGNIYSSSLTVPVGTGAGRLREADYILYPKNVSAWSSPCSSVLDNVVISPKKELKICCGMMEQHVPELTIGIWDKSRIAEILYEANIDLISNWLALEGPYGIRKFILEKSPNTTFSDKYVNHCHLCNDIFTRPETRAVLAEYCEEKRTELIFRRGILEALRYPDV